MQEVQRFNKVLKSCVLLGDLILLNLLLWGFEQFFGNRFWCENCGSILQGMALITLCYLLCNMHSGVILHRSVVRPEQIMVRVLRNMVPFVLLSVCILLLFHFEFSHSRLFGLFYIVLILVIVSYRLAFRYFLELYRKQGGNVRKVILIGSHENMQELYHAMTDDPTSGYRVLGYFEDFPSDRYPSDVSYLGHPQEVNNFLEQNVGRVDQLYCSLPSARSAEIVPIINYCENHLVRFFSVPNVRNYLKRRMHFEMLGNVPVLSIRREPLELLENRIVKRTFDIVCSTLFLCTIFPFIYIIVGVAIKMSSPGPIFFKQKRSGEDGKEFWCYKFRSMRVNTQCDTLQATEHDPRKTRFDCSGFVRYLMKDYAGLDLPRTSREQARHGTDRAAEDIRVGDFVTFGSSLDAVSHVGIYIGNDRMIHGDGTGKGVAVCVWNDRKDIPRIADPLGV